MQGVVEQVAEALSGVVLTGEQAEHLGALIDDRTHVEAPPRWLYVDDDGPMTFETRRFAREAAGELGGTVYDLAFLADEQARRAVAELV